jgi:hypothetical protein
MAANRKMRERRYLREARLAAGYSSRCDASMAVPYAPETLGRHERGETAIGPEDAVLYAECYNRPDILYRYCSECPVGQRIGVQTSDRDLPWAALRINQRLRKAKEVADTLEDIAEDGIVDETERPKFEAALAYLRELSCIITDILVWNYAQPRKHSASSGGRA